MHCWREDMVVSISTGLVILKVSTEVTVIKVVQSLLNGLFISHMVKTSLEHMLTVLTAGGTRQCLGSTLLMAHMSGREPSTLHIKQSHGQLGPEVGQVLVTRLDIFNMVTHRVPDDLQLLLNGFIGDGCSTDQ